MTHDTLSIMKVSKKSHCFGPIFMTYDFFEIFDQN
jgi:hypothetical protein